MQTGTISLPGYQLNEYQLVLVPHEDLRTRIMKLREEFGTAYKTGQTKYSKPQVTLALFQQHQLMEDRIINRLRNIGLGQYPFKVEIRDFGSFPSHTVFLQVCSKLPVQELVKHVRQDLGKLLKLDEEHKPHFLMEPYISVASRLKPWQYEKAWLEYSHRHFSAKFIADRMYLMKKGPADTGFRTIASFEFENLPVGVKQGELFG